MKKPLKYQLITECQQTDPDGTVTWVPTRVSLGRNNKGIDQIPAVVAANKRRVRLADRGLGSVVRVVVVSLGCERGLIKRPLLRDRR